MYRITQCLSVGPFASSERAEKLLAAGVTHVLNVSDVPSHVAAGDNSFADVVWVPMSDSRRLAPATVIQAINALHELASAPGAHVYVHCVAGQIRSPTILWLYLMACGVPLQDARDWIEKRAKDAVAGHYRMVDREHVSLAQKHGSKYYLPHPRPDVIVPFPLSEDAEE
ncbi:dual specificity protein phosphatase 13 isoform a-like : Dual specificity protein phosphatase OS=Isosphaera pallida (strain ATCC 43644 / DSM 9630 / IS1B) GN=Isop_2646 PE=4 SV=1: DSPc [Gemmata massiliana]|uniref:Tyrosine specific protein phosphatases domain-containing protein n=1 Tax=Gemmata massiliana TaxID=1210884 RepID=A0A6P2DPS9_9BACT|nr:dual specificity protein phosphatase [Gemmata massiliana]VTS03277.1 dual specificity protein phosphatase 13 isoform a-like : Dual specificity protein phosphatase OS=Isosphaera pallida (strain ATCC 43644 / DSM 9630 / IS1B) GN=Isop_2646 PE=4 SV=1: DSPc [Gemmata massiliana]